MDDFHFKRLTDPIHGTFGISQLEAEIISTPVFQRLHSVRQLGLAHLVFPGAGYSRFSHSLGACHIAGRMVRAINQNSKGTPISDKEMQLYRLAGLLHDIGHYPFSHAMEHGIGNFYGPEKYLEKKGEPEKALVAEDKDTPPSYDHEGLGRVIIDYDPDIGEVLKRNGFSKSDVKGVFSREDPEILTNLVSSDLDCDRLDYLMRTAISAGMPYGTVDIEYITSQVCLDSAKRLCLTKKASKSADHFLISRYFDYTQLVFHKTLVGLEEALKDVIGGLIEKGFLDCSGTTMKKKIAGRTYASFDDQWLISLIREALEKLDGKDEIFARKAQCVLMRDAPKMVAASDIIADRDAAEQEFNNHVGQIRDCISELSKKFGIPESLWHLWSRSLKITKVGSHIPFGAKDDLEEDSQQVVRVLTTDPRADKIESKPLIEHNFALTKQLANVALFCIRLYVHLKPGEERVRDEIYTELRHRLKYFPFSD